MTPERAMELREEITLDACAIQYIGRHLLQEVPYELETLKLDPDTYPSLTELDRGCRSVETLGRAVEALAERITLNLRRIPIYYHHRAPVSATAGRRPSRTEESDRLEEIIVEAGA